ncbi:MAG: hypothetical protein GX059_00745 [Clostridiales bacterium]|nr:hypothetical protein [Clostridiales bacterium]
MESRYRRYAFLLVQLVLYLTFLSFDIRNTGVGISTGVKFAVVVLCFLYVITSNNTKSKDYIYLCLAITFTVISDCLILYTEYYLYGVITFTAAQQLHGIRLDILREREEGNPINRSRTLALRLLSQIVLGTVVYAMLMLAGVGNDALLAVSILYFISLCFNVIRSIMLCFHGKSRDIRLFAWGMVLFLLCDINVGIFNLSGFINVGPVYEVLYGISSISMWLFYAPSQVLIVLSGDSN